jgi:hypothetical protein
MPQHNHAAILRALQDELIDILQKPARTLLRDHVE